MTMSLSSNRPYVVFLLPDFCPLKSTHFMVTLKTLHKPCNVTSKRGCLLFTVETQ